MHEIRYAILILFVFCLHIGLFAHIQAGYHPGLPVQHHNGCYKAASLTVALAAWNNSTSCDGGLPSEDLLLERVLCFDELYNDMSRP